MPRNKLTKFFRNNLFLIFYLSYLNFDINYYVRTGLTILYCKLTRKLVNISEPIIHYGICTTNDVDYFLDHMNNARYLRELDFVRLHFYHRTGLYDFLVENKIPVFQTASSIRYRRKLSIFSLYRVETKLIYWEDKNIYLEHKFITLKDNFVCAIVLGKQSVVGFDISKLINRLLDKDESYRPKPPEELEDWIKSNEKSSAKLRPIKTIQDN